MSAWIEYEPLDNITLAKRNPRQHDVEAILYSIIRFGYVSPVVVNEATGHLVAGHGRVAALKMAREQNVPPPRLIKVENDAWLIPVVRGVEFDNEHEAEAFLLADNKIQELTSWVDDELTVMLHDIQDATATLEGTGFDDSFLDTLVTGTPESSTQEIDPNDFDMQHKCPKCGFEFDD